MNDAEHKCHVDKSRELKENVIFIKSKRQKWALGVAKWVSSAFLWADYEKMTHLMLSKDPALLKEKIELRRKLNVEWPYMLILMRVWNGNISNFAIPS